MGGTRALAAVLVVSRSVWAVDERATERLLVGAAAKGCWAGRRTHEGLAGEGCAVKVHADHVRELVVVEAEDVPAPACHVSTHTHTH